MDCLGSVLLVDDEETFRESTIRLLRREGVECQSACNGDEAVQALQDRRFDALIADIRMPGNPDLRVARIARDLDSQIAIIVVTGYPSTETAIRCIDLSVSAYLTKPLDFEELVGHVQSAISQSQNRRALAAIQEQLQICLVDLEIANLPQSNLNQVDDPVLPRIIHTLAACLSELLRLGRPGVASQAINLCELLNCPQQPAHRQAILHAIEVLKQTKESFKSKTLADLRARLEKAIRSRAEA